MQCGFWDLANVSDCTGSVQKVCVIQCHFTGKAQYPGEDPALHLSLAPWELRGLLTQACPVCVQYISLAPFHGCPAPNWAHIHLKSMGPCCRCSDACLDEKSSFHLFFNVLPVFIQQPVFLALKEAVDKQLLSMLLTFYLSFPCLCSCCFRLNSPSCSMNGNQLLLMITLFCPPLNLPSFFAPFLKWGTRTAIGTPDVVKSLASSWSLPRGGTANLKILSYSGSSLSMKSANYCIQSFYLKTSSFHDSPFLNS